MSNKDLIRFLAKVDKQANAPCWTWVGSYFGNYGTFWYQGKYVLAHRLMFEHANQGTARVVRHKCDNKRCVNPEHLLGGSQSDNVRDDIERGSRTKFTEEQIMDIRRLSINEAADKYGIAKCTAWRIRTGKSNHYGKEGLV